MTAARDIHTRPLLHGIRIDIVAQDAGQVYLLRNQIEAAGDEDLPPLRFRSRWEMGKTGDFTCRGCLVHYCVQSDTFREKLWFSGLSKRIIFIPIPKVVDGALDEDCVDGPVKTLFILLEAADQFMRAHLLVILVDIVHEGLVGARAGKLVIPPNQLHNLIVCYPGLHAAD